MKVINPILAHVEKSYLAESYIDVIDKTCLCRPCFDPKDFGSYGEGKVAEFIWFSDWKCKTRFENGCPYPFPKPRHKPETLTESEKEFINNVSCAVCGKVLLPINRLPKI